MFMYMYTQMHVLIVCFVHTRTYVCIYTHTRLIGVCYCLFRPPPPPPPNRNVECQASRDSCRRASAKASLGEMQEFRAFGV